MSLLALDLGTKSAFAAWLGRDPPVWGAVNFAPHAQMANSDGAIMGALRDWLSVLVDRYEPAWLSAEVPWVSAQMQAQTIRRLSGFYMVAAEIAHSRKVGWRPAETWAVEKHFLGKSGHKSAEKKRLYVEMCHDVMKWSPVTQDEADALAVLSWMQSSMLVERRFPGPLFVAKPRASGQPANARHPGAADLPMLASLRTTGR